MNSAGMPRGRRGGARAVGPGLPKITENNARRGVRRHRSARRSVDAVRVRPSISAWTRERSSTSTLARRRPQCCITPAHSHGSRPADARRRPGQSPDLRPHNSCRKQQGNLHTPHDSGVMGHALRIEQELCRGEPRDGGCLPDLCRVSALSRRWTRTAKVHGQPEADPHSAGLPLRILCGSNTQPPVYPRA